MNPVDEFLLVKQSAGPAQLGRTLLEAGKGFTGAVGKGVATGLGAAVAVGTGVAIKNIYDAATAKRDFRQMLEWNQDLHHTDQRLLNQSFRTLRRFAPDMSKDPLVSGSMIRRMMESPAGAAGLIHEAIGSEKELPTPIMRGFADAAGHGAAEGVGKMPWELHRGPDVKPTVRRKTTPQEMAAAQRAAGAVPMPAMRAEMGEGFLDPLGEARRGWGPHHQGMDVSPDDAAWLHQDLAAAGGLEVGKARRGLKAESVAGEREQTPSGPISMRHAGGAGFFRRKP